MLKMLHFQKNSIKMKNCETFYEVQTASWLKQIIQRPPNPQLTPHQTKPYYVFGTKLFLRRYTEIYRHLLSNCYKNARQSENQEKTLMMSTRTRG